MSNKPTTETAMTEAEFKQQLKLRGEEYTEYEKMVQLYAVRIKNIQGILRGSMIMAFRAGVISMIDLLDTKAKTIRYERDMKNAVTKDYLGN